MRRRRGGWLAAFSIVVAVVMLLPIAVVVAASLTPQGFIEVPPSGLSLRWYREIWDDPDWAGSFWLSAQIAVSVASLAVLVGVPAGLGLHRLGGGRVSALLQTFLLSPLMVPTIVIGLALVRFFTLLGVPLSPVTIVLGQTLIAVPYVVRLVLASLAGSDPTLLRAATILGAGPFTAFRRVTLPLIRQALIASILFCVIVSLDDVNVALFLADVTSTPLSVRLFSYITQNADPMGAAVASLLVGIAALALLICDRLVGIDWMLGLRRRG